MVGRVDGSAKVIVPCVSGFCELLWLVFLFTQSLFVGWFITVRGWDPGPSTRPVPHSPAPLSAKDWAVWLVALTAFECSEVLLPIPHEVLMPTVYFRSQTAFENLVLLPGSVVACPGPSDVRCPGVSPSLRRFS